MQTFIIYARDTRRVLGLEQAPSPDAAIAQWARAIEQQNSKPDKPVSIELTRNADGSTRASANDADFTPAPEIDVRAAIDAQFLQETITQVLARLGMPCQVVPVPLNGPKPASKHDKPQLTVVRPGPDDTVH